MRWRGFSGLVGVLGFVVMAGGLATAAISKTDTAAATGVTAMFTFDGMPASPLPYTAGSFLDGWDVQIHDRDSQLHPGTTSPDYPAEHGADCSAPPATHQTGAPIANHVYQCHDHFMTAIEGEGYGVIYTTPPDMLDFSQGGSVTFDVSTEDNNNRQWWDVSITPFLESQATALMSTSSNGVDLQKPNNDSLVVTTDNGDNAPHLMTTVNGNITDYVTSANYHPQNEGISASVNQAMNRQTFKLTVTKTDIRFERLASATAPYLLFWDQPIPALGWTQGVVTIGTHSYDPGKAGSGRDTYHWDNVAISPAVPFYIGKIVEPWTQGGTIHAAQPAPANSYLRFEAICRPVLNGVAGTKMTDDGHPEHFSSYLMPVAPGSQSWNVSFTQDSHYDGACLAQGFSVWSPGGAPPILTPTPPATQTNTATNTPTPNPTLPGTRTASPTPTRSTSGAPTPLPTFMPPTTVTPASNPPRVLWVTGATVSSKVVVRGSQIMVTTDVTAIGTSTALVDIEIYDSTNRRVVQQFCDQQLFIAQDQKSFGLIYFIPTNAAKGSWTVRVGIFSPSWGTLQKWDDDAATFTVR